MSKCVRKDIGSRFSCQFPSNNQRNCHTLVRVGRIFNLMVTLRWTIDAICTKSFVSSGCGHFYFGYTPLKEMSNLNRNSWANYIMHIFTTHISCRAIVSLSSIFCGGFQTKCKKFKSNHCVGVNAILKIANDLCLFSLRAKDSAENCNFSLNLWYI